MWQELEKPRIVIVTQRLAPVPPTSDAQRVLMCFVGDELEAAAVTSDSLWLRCRHLSTGQSGLYPVSCTNYVSRTSASPSTPETIAEESISVAHSAVREMGLLAHRATQSADPQLLCSVHHRMLPLLTICHVLDKEHGLGPEALTGLGKRLWKALDAAETDPVLAKYLTKRLRSENSFCRLDVANTSSLALFDSVCYS